jgi:hypothetical protein
LLRFALDPDGEAAPARRVRVAWVGLGDPAGNIDLYGCADPRTAESISSATGCVTLSIRRNDEFAPSRSALGSTSPQTTWRFLLIVGDALP